MFLDILLLIVLVLATYTGYKRGLIVGVFSLIAIIVGLAAAMKLSVVAAAYLRSYFSWEGKWVPPLSFLLVLVGVILLIRLGANALEKGAQLISLGWINALGGILFYWAICLLSCSVILFYLSPLPFIPTTIEGSITYPYLKEIGPWVMDCFAKLFPVFKGMYQQLQDFFEQVKEQIPKP
ncbi:MAG: CvpA family protein [Bacteroidetes bacterium]|nr:CvpA family protein [Bacteroidota bacterium]